MENLIYNNNFLPIASLLGAFLLFILIAYGMYSKLYFYKRKVIDGFGRPKYYEKYRIRTTDLDDAIFISALIFPFFLIISSPYLILWTESNDIANQFFFTAFIRFIHLQFNFFFDWKHISFILPLSIWIFLCEFYFDKWYISRSSIIQNGLSYFWLGFFQLGTFLNNIANTSGWAFFWTGSVILFGIIFLIGGKYGFHLHNPSGKPKLVLREGYRELFTFLSKTRIVNLITLFNYGIVNQIIPFDGITIGSIIWWYLFVLFLNQLAKCGKPSWV